MRPRPELAHHLQFFKRQTRSQRNPAYFVWSQSIYPGDQAGYVNVSKISSLSNGAPYTVTFSKRIVGSDLQQLAKMWLLSDEGKAASHEIGNVKVDASWKEYFEQHQP